MKYLSKMTLLVVDDAPFMRNVLRSVLGHLGCRRIVEATDGADALEKIESYRPHLIITDWEMPVLNGGELLHLIARHADPAVAHTPVIVLTGHADKALVIEAKRLGAGSVLCKPVSAAVLTERLQWMVQAGLLKPVQGPRRTG